MANFDFELLAEIAENAPVAGNSSYKNLGRTWMDNLQVSKWDGNNKKFEKTAYTGGAIAEGGTLEFQLHQEITKKDGDTFTKTWYLQVRENGKRTKTDWGTHVKPSIVHVFKDLKSFFKAMSGNGSFCEIEDFDTGRDREDKNGKIDDATGEVKKYAVTTPKFVTLFKNKSEMDKVKKAREEARAKAEMSFANDGDIPQEVINSFKGFVKACGGLDEAREALDGDQYEEYDVEEVIKVAFPE
jgi:hypothetical protein